MSDIRLMRGEGEKRKSNFKSRGKEGKKCARKKKEQEYDRGGDRSYLCYHVIGAEQEARGKGNSKGKRQEGVGTRGKGKKE